MQISAIMVACHVRRIFLSFFICSSLFLPSNVVNNSIFKYGSFVGRPALFCVLYNRFRMGTPLLRQTGFTRFTLTHHGTSKHSITSQKIPGRELDFNLNIYMDV